jgi:hypothetical protein
LGLRRIGIAPVDASDVAQAKHAPADGEVDRGEILFGAERARHSDRDGLLPRLDDAGGSDDVLRLERCDQSRAVEAESCEIGHRELDENLLVLRAKYLDF